MRNPAILISLFAVVILTVSVSFAIEVYSPYSSTNPGSIQKDSSPVITPFPSFSKSVSLEGSPASGEDKASAFFDATTSEVVRSTGDNATDLSYNGKKDYILVFNTARGKPPQASESNAVEESTELNALSDSLEKMGLKNELSNSIKFNIIPAMLLKSLNSQQAARLRQEGKDSFKLYEDKVVKVVLMDSVPLIGADRVWALNDSLGLNVTGRGVRVGVIDTGVDYTHADFGNCTRQQFLSHNCSKVAGGWNFVANNSDPMDDFGHGTHVAGIIAANGSLKGVAPDATLYAYKALDSTGSGFESNIINAIQTAVDPNGDGNASDHLNIISLSIGGQGDPDDPMSQAIDSAVKAGVVAVVAAGNYGSASQTITSPGTAREAITVGAAYKINYTQNLWDQNPRVDQITSFSSRGPVVWMGGELNKPDVVAPGAIICSTAWPGIVNNPFLNHLPYTSCFDNAHWLLAGTSMATPMVSGVAALILQAHPDWSPAEVKMALRDTAKNLNDPATSQPYDINTQGYGRVDALAAVSLSQAPPIARLSTSGEVHGLVIEVNGTAKGRGFLNYSLYYARNSSALNWIEITASSTPVESGSLSDWGVGGLQDGFYELKLVVTGSASNSVDYSTVRIANTEIASPISVDDFHLNTEVPGWRELDINGTVSGNDFDHYEITWCKLDDPVSSACSNLTSSGVQLVNGGSARVENGVLAVLHPSSIPGMTTGFYYFLLSKHGKSGAESLADVKTFIDMEVAPGWPVQVTGASALWNQVFARLESKTREDVVILEKYGVKVYAFSPEGIPIPGWPVSISNAGDCHLKSKPIAVDLDDDGVDEVLAGDDCGMLHAWKSDGTYLQGWPKKLVTDSIFSVSAFEDSNGKKLIVKDDNSNTYLLDSKGNVLPGWPKALALSYPFTAGFTNENAPAVGDFGDDSGKKIVVAAYDVNKSTGQEFKPSSFATEVWVLGVDGSNSSGWPKLIRGKATSSPTLADVDYDGKLEVILPTISAAFQRGSEYYENITIHIFKSDGSYLQGWPKTVTGHLSGYIFFGYGLEQGYGAKTVVGDLRGNGNLKIVFIAGGCLHVFDAKKAVEDPGWPQCRNNLEYLAGTPTIANLDEDNQSEVVVTSHVSVWYPLPLFDAFKADGSEVQGFPKSISGSPSFEGLQTADADGMGENELLSTVTTFDSDNWLYLWKLPSVSKPVEEWPLIEHESLETNSYVPSYSPKGLLPDLVSQLNYSLVGYLANGFPVFNITESISNIGLAKAGLSYTLFTVDNYSNLLAVEPLLPEYSRTYSYTYTCTSNSVHYFSSAADYNNSIAEVSKENNNASLTLTCVNAYPDLIANLTVLNATLVNGVFNAKKGRTVSVLETTSNTGASPSPRSTTQVNLPPSSISGAFRNTTYAVPALAPNAAYSVMGRFYCGGNGVFLLNTTANYNNKVVESRKDNNFFQIQVRCV